MRYRKKLMPPVQEFLFSYEEAVLEVQRLERRAEELESQCSKLAAQYSGSPRGGSGGSPNATWDAFCDALTRVEEQKQEYLRREAEVEAFIKRLMTVPKYSDVLTPTMVKKAIRSAPLHDVGKIAIEDAVLRKDSSLNGTEFDRMKQHSVIGGDLFLHITDVITDKEFGRVAEQIARYHHERWDGSGYPEGLKGKQIPLVARIMSIVDVYDALTSERSYKKPYSHEKSVDIIRTGRGTNFDPELVDEFIAYENEIKDCLKSKAEFNEKKYFRSRT